MAVQDGRSFILRIWDSASPPAFTVIGGFTTNNLTINREPVDVTNKSTTNKWRQVAKFGVRSIQVTGTGMFTDSAAENTLVNEAMSNDTTTLPEFQVVIPGLGTFEGAFHIDSLEYNGDDNAPVTYTITLSSADQIQFASS